MLEARYEDGGTPHEDDVLVAVLKALGIDASNDEAINQSITSIKSERETRVVAPTVLHIVGKESKVAVHGGMFDVPEASITLENGKQFTGKISHEGGEKIAHEIDGSFFCMQLNPEKKVEYSSEKVFAKGYLLSLGADVSCWRVTVTMPLPELL